MVSLAEILEIASLKVWDFIHHAGAAGFSPREETLTELTLTSMHRAAPAQVIIRKTTTAEESRNGADFALALDLGPSGWMNLLVQAKKLDSTSLSYAELSKPKAHDQARSLRKEAARLSALPAYVLYNGSGLADEGQTMNLGGCTRLKLARHSTGPPWHKLSSPAGCTLVSAEAMERILATARVFSPMSFDGDASPWECLLCPVEGGGGWPKPLLGDGNPSGAPPSQAPFIMPSPPPWARVLIEGGPTSTFADFGLQELVPDADYLAVVRSSSLL